jgi:hypothetical protein
MQSSSVLSTLCGLYQQSLPLPSALPGNLSFRLSPVRIPMSHILKNIFGRGVSLVLRFVSWILVFVQFDTAGAEGPDGQ